MKVFDLTPYIENEKQRLKNKVIEIRNKYGLIPRLFILTDDLDPSVKTYYRSKVKMCLELGIDYRVVIAKNTSIIESTIFDAGRDISMGVIAQLPMKDELKDYYFEKCNTITENIDVDGFFNPGGVLQNSDGVIPATAKAIRNILRVYKAPIKNSPNVVIYGRGELVGFPLASLLIKEGYTVTVLNSKSNVSDEVLKTADVIVLATGKEGSLRASQLDENQKTLILNVGTIVKNGKLRTEFGIDISENHLPHVEYTAAKGAIGPCTVLALIDNLLVNIEERLAAEGKK